MEATRLIIAAPLLLAAVQPASAQVVRFELLNQSSASDLTPDGRYIVGSALGGAGGYIWSRETGAVILGALGAVAVSDDGSVVLGSMDDGINPQSVAALWTSETGWESLGTLPNPAPACGSSSSAYELSADGTVAVGLGWQDGCNAYAFRWTEETGMVAMELLANGGNRASVISGDGALIGGFAQGSFGRTPAIWDADGNGQLLDPPDGDVLGEVHGISDDGTILLGEWDNKPFTWTEGDAAPDIFNPLLPGWIGAAMDIADDGTIVGFDRLFLSRRAWIRPNGDPIVLLQDYLEGLGVTNVPASGLDVCQAISTSGNIIIGHSFFEGAWLLNLCAADFENDGMVGTTDLLSLLAAWGPCAGCVEDLDEDGSVGVTDLLLLLGVWGECI